MSNKAEKTYTIFVNESSHVVSEEKISYGEVVSLYTNDGGAPSTEYLIKYSHGHSDNLSGTLTPGQKVRVQDGMRFRVTGTGES